MDMPLRVDRGWTKTEQLRVQQFLDSNFHANTRGTNFSYHGKRRRSRLLAGGSPLSQTLDTILNRRSVGQIHPWSSG